MSVNKIYLMRHGQLEKQQVLAGQTDLSLSETGVQQMKSAIAALDFSYCISSPLSRCKQIASEICSQRGFSLITDDRIKEFDFGDWDGKPYNQLWQLPKPNIGDFWRAPNEVIPPSGESYQQFQNRVSEFWQQLTTDCEQDTLVICHAGVIKEIVRLVLGCAANHPMQQKLQIDYAAVITIEKFKDDNHAPWLTLRLS